MSTIKPIADRILVKVDAEQKKTEGGLYLAENVLSEYEEGTVVEVGPGRLLESGTIIPLEIYRGDKVIFGRNLGCDIMLNNSKHRILKEGQVYAKYQEK